MFTWCRRRHVALLADLGPREVRREAALDAAVDGGSDAHALGVVLGHVQQPLEGHAVARKHRDVLGHARVVQHGADLHRRHM